MQKKLLGIYNALLTIETFFLLFFLLTAILLSSSQIILRNFFDSGIFWADSALRILVLWIGLIGAMYASRKKRHIRIDILSHYLNEELRNKINRITEFVTAITCGIVAFHSIKFIQYEYEDGQIAFANVPVWLAEAIIPIAFIIIGLRYFIYSVLPSHTLNSESDDINSQSESK